MDTEIIREGEVIDLQAIEARLRPKSSDELRRHFFSCFDSAAAFIAEASVCVKLMHERGEDLSDIPLHGIFRRIAAGQILPQLVWKFMNSPAAREVERLPLDDQKRLVADTVVEVATLLPTGQPDKMRVDLLTAPKEVVKRVIGPDGIRSVDEQLARIGQDKARSMVIDAKATRKMKPEADVREPLDRQITVKLTASELEALKIRAALGRCRETEIARRGLLQSGVLKKPERT